MYIGQMSLWFTNAAKMNGITEDEEIQDLIDNQAQIFGFIQILCVVWAYPIGKNFSYVKSMTFSEWMIYFR